MKCYKCYAVLDILYDVHMIIEQLDQYKVTVCIKTA